MRCYIALKDVNYLTVRYLPDDAFYYFTIARNIVSGNGSTLDLIAPTNGYHPLWMGLILPSFKLFSGLDAPVTASLIIAAILSTLTACFVYAILGELGVSRVGRFVGALLFYYNHVTIQFSLNGLETATCLAGGALVFWMFLNGVGERGKRGAVLLGVALGLSVLARTDMALLGTPIACVVGVRLLLRKCWGSVACLVVAGALTIAPWFLWNYMTFGDFVQVSGKALAYYEHKTFAMEHPGVGWLSAEYGNELWRRGFLAIVGIGFETGFSPIAWERWHEGFYIVWAMLTALIVSALVSRFFGSGRLARQVLRCWPALLIILTYIPVHALIRWTVREWYYAVPGMFLFVLLAVWLNAIFSRLPRAIGATCLLFVCSLLLAAYQFQFYEVHVRGRYAHQVGFIEGERLMRQTFAPGERLGISDCGYPSYVSNCQIVNLDGLTNNAAYHAARKGRLADHIIEAGIVASHIRPYLLKDYFMGPDWRGKLTDVGGWLRPSELIAPGREILYHMNVCDQDSESVLRKGWTPCDGEAWNDGQGTLFAVPMERNWGGAMLAVRAIPFVHGETCRDQTITWSLNGHGQPVAVDAPNNWSYLVFPLPEEGVIEGENIVEFNYRYAVAPADIIPGNGDARRLSLLIREVAVVSTPDDKTGSGRASE